MPPGDSVSEPEASRPGSVLRAEREALGVTVREISETLNLSISIIEAIESDDLDRLPGPVFARGYVRGYARLLELDPEPLVAHLARPPDPVAAHASPEPPIWEWIRSRPALVLGSAAGLLVAFVVVLVIWLWPEGDSESAAPAAADDGVFGRAVSPLPDAGEAGAPPGPGEGPAVPDQSGAGSEGEAASGSTGSSTAAPAAALAAPADDGADGSPHRITDIGDDRLSFSFTDECWVEIRNAAGAKLYSDLGRADSRLDLVGQGPFRILLGYAPGAQLSFNGEAVALAPHTRDNVATLVLGQ